MTVKERIAKYILYKKGSKRGFSLSIGMSENYISSMRNSIQPDIIDKIAVCYPDLNTGWLLTGQGEMLKNQEFDDIGAGNKTNQDEVIMRLTEENSRLKKENSLQDDLIKMLKEKIANLEHPITIEAKKEKAS